MTRYIYFLLSLCVFHAGLRYNVDDDDDDDDVNFSLCSGGMDEIDEKIKL